MRSLTEILAAVAAKQKNPERDKDGNFVSKKKQTRYATIRTLRIIKQNRKEKKEDNG